MLPTSAPAFRCSSPPSRSRLLAAITLLFALTPIAHAFDPLSDIPDSTYVTDGPVNAIVRSDSTIYIAGQFTTVGPRTGPGIEVALDGTQPLGQPEISGRGATLGGGAVIGVRAVIEDGAGGWYVSGLFDHVGGLPRTNIVHILANRTVDTGFAPTVNGNVTTLALAGTTLYVGGLFTTISGQTRNNIAALNTVDGSATAFDPNANAAVTALALSADNATLYVGGTGFTTIGGQARNGLAAIDTASGTATGSFVPVLARTSPTAIATVSAIALDASTVYISGNFDTVGGLARRALAAVNISDGSPVAAFIPAPNYFNIPAAVSIELLSLSGSTLYVGGSFDTMGGQARKNLAAVNVATGLATEFDPSPSANLLSLKVVGTTVYVGGGFQTIGGQPRKYMAAVDAASGAATAFNPGPNGTINAIGVSATGVYIGGLFSSIGGVARTSLAAINPATGVPTDWNPNPANNGNGVTLASLALDGSLLYVGGTYLTIGGQSRKNLSAVSTVDGLANAFNPTSSGGVNAIVVNGNSVFAGGAFATIGGQSRFALAELNRDTGLATAFNANADSSIKSIVLVGTTLYAAGGFLHLGGQERARVGAVDTLTGLATAFNPLLAHASSPTANVLSLSGTTLYVGGTFDSSAGTARKNAAAFDISTGNLTSFDPQVTLGSSSGAVNAIASDGSTVYLGGYFGAVGGQPRGLLAAVSAADGSVLPFNPNATGTAIFALATASNGSLYVGGSYQTYNLAYQQGFAKFSPEVPFDLIFRGGFDTP